MIDYDWQGIFREPRQAESVEVTDILANITELSHELGLDIKIPDTFKYKGTFMYVNKALPANTLMVSVDVARSFLLELREQEK